MVSIDEFGKLDLRVGEIKQAKEHPNADKLCVLKVDLGEIGERTIVAGIKNHYDLEKLINKKIIVITNLDSVTLRGIKSEGMLLAASDKNTLSLLTPDSNISNGAKVS